MRRHVTPSARATAHSSSDSVRDTGAEQHSHEIGGVGGVEALKRLRSVVHRTDSPWQPASPDESFEIVRRRLFKAIAAGRPCSPRRHMPALRRDVREAPVGVPLRGAPRRLRDTAEGRLPDPPRAVRPPVPGLVDARALPAHPRRPAAHGHRGARAVDAQRQEPADPAVVDPAGGHQRLRGDHQPPGRQLAARRRPGRRRTEQPARQARPRAHRARPRPGRPARRAHDLLRLGAHSEACRRRIELARRAASRTCGSRSARRSPATRRRCSATRCGD